MVLSSHPPLPLSHSLPPPALSVFCAPRPPWRLGITHLADGSRAGGAWPTVTLQRGLSGPALHSNMSENFKGQHRLGLLARPRHCGCDARGSPLRSLPRGRPAPPRAAGSTGLWGPRECSQDQGPCSLADPVDRGWGALPGALRSLTLEGGRRRPPKQGPGRGRAGVRGPRPGLGLGGAGWRLWPSLDRHLWSRVCPAGHSAPLPQPPAGPGRAAPASWGGSDRPLHRPLLPQALCSASERPAGPWPGPLFGGSEKPPQVPRDQGWPEWASSLERMKREQHLVTAGAGLPPDLGPR